MKHIEIVKDVKMNTYIKLLIILIATITTQTQPMYSFPIYTGTFFYYPMPQPYVSPEVCPDCRRYNETLHYFFNSGYCTRCYKKYPVSVNRSYLPDWGIITYSNSDNLLNMSLEVQQPRRIREIGEIGVHESCLKNIIYKYYEAKLEIYLTKVLCKLIQEYSLSKDEFECNCDNNRYLEIASSILKCDSVLKIESEDFYNFCVEHEEKEKQEALRIEREELRIENEKKEKQRLIEAKLFNEFVKFLEEEFKEDDNKPQKKLDQKDNLNNFDPIKEISELYK